MNKIYILSFLMLYKVLSDEPLKNKKILQDCRIGQACSYLSRDLGTCCCYC